MLHVLPSEILKGSKTFQAYFGCQNCLYILYVIRKVISKDEILTLIVLGLYKICLISIAQVYSKHQFTLQSLYL